MLKKIFTAFTYSLSGLRACFKAEFSFRADVFFFLCNIVFCLLYNLSFTQSSFLVCATLLILIAELLNSGIEKVADLITKEFHPGIKYAKDAGSAAVMLAFVIYFIAFFSVILG